jgi:biotin carboxylase
MKRVLLLSTTTGYQAGEFRRAAERMGAPLVLASNRCHVLEDPWRDGALPIRLEKPEAAARQIVAYARDTPIHGVVALGDAITPIAALAARGLGLPYHRPEAVEACRNKYLARERYRSAGLPTPWYTRLPAAAPPADPGVPFPCVLKPLGLSGSRGVIRADDLSQFQAAFRRIQTMVEASDWIQVEGFIPGREVSVEGIVTCGRLRVLAIFDKPDPLDGPYFEETIYVTPSRLDCSTQNGIVETTDRAARAVGLWHGPLHAEMRLNPEGVWMLEMAARPIGGLCARALRFTGGASLEELILRHALGEDVSGLERESQASGVMMIPIPQGGILEGVEGVDAALEVPGVKSVEITAKLGQELAPLPEGASYLGFIFARGETPEAVEGALREAHGALQFRVLSALPVL